jgi:hypothetical protein
MSLKYHFSFFLDFAVTRFGDSPFLVSLEEIFDAFSLLIPELR